LEDLRNKSKNQEFELDYIKKYNLEYKNDKDALQRLNEDLMYELEIKNKILEEQRLTILKLKDSKEKDVKNVKGEH